MNKAPRSKIEKVSQTSGCITDDQLSLLRQHFPEAFTEGKVDFTKLHDTLGDVVDDRTERYSFTWAGKKDAIRLLQVPSRATLIPAKDESVDFDNAPHVFIEGDNLEVLKLLYKPYFGRVKMIYIDPPYNTGKDFIYPDNYADPLDTYLKLTGQKDADGNMLTSNADTNGRYHSSWLSMMYPRLFLGRQLLRDDGVIFVSIDDHEVSNLRTIMNEIFGEENFLAQLVWEKGRKNDAKLFSVGHEYMIVYAKSAATLRENNTVWREQKPGAKEIWDEYVTLLAKHGKDNKKIERDLKDWFNQLAKTHPSKRLARYKNVDEHGPWRDDNISWPGGGGPTYDVIHPVTKKPCKVPERGWVYSTPETMQRMIEIGVVVFREDHTQPPLRKSHLKPIEYEVSDSDELDDPEDEKDDESLATQVMPSCIYKQSQVTVKYLRKLMGAKVFDNPKDHEILARIIRYCTSPNDIILDFFAGSCSTAHAILSANSQEKSVRKYIMVQLPEPTPEKSAARKAGYKTISDLGKDRIRRAQKEIKSKEGFKAFKLSESNYRPWKGTEERTMEKWTEQMDLFVDPLVDGWKPESVIYEVAVKEGFSLNMQIERLKGKSTANVYRVSDPDKEQSFYICLDDEVSLLKMSGLKLTKDDLFICRDKALTDEGAANLALQCRLKTI